MDRSNIAYSGTMPVYGQARGVVVATGEDPEVGRIGTMVGNTAASFTEQLAAPPEDIDWTAWLEYPHVVELCSELAPVATILEFGHS